MKQIAFYYDANRCSGCKTCQIACKDKHGLAVGILWRRVYEVSGGRWIQEGKAWRHSVRSYYMSMACHHCSDPICVQTCPTGAMHKTDMGIVLVDATKCVGCRYCEWACPHGAPRFDAAAGVMSKCTFCIDELQSGKEPACVAACPMRVLAFGERVELEQRYQGVNTIFPLPQSHLTDPSIVITPHRNACKAENDQAIINNREEV